ncbi:glycoside hydrolase [Danxiaibacter flavus]|uniref:Glycoside hydrolase n=1 Tax=Danxiaibacter flavus TaxID=3049108 RepID=A0ABV3Z9D5_9BACT|nr:glycoside hydrolase [Chitinophagaceae bacterium DXS]
MQKNKRLLLFFIAYSVCTHLSAQQNAISFTVDANNKAQVMDNIGASGCWFSEGIGKNWPEKKRERIAELLFSREVGANGSPLGIGLSCWRFNIGGGTAEQGDSSGIKDFRRRVECFLSPQGTYDWSKQAGYTWFVKKAKSYGVEKLIAFSNTPPVQFTQNGLGYKTSKDYKSNLKPGSYSVYTDFLAEVLDHFKKEGLAFDYVSPVNEPQWDWSHKYMEADQEGTPWRNDEIAHVIRSLDESLTQKKLSTKILLPEAGMLTYLYGGKGNAASQMQSFLDPAGKNYVGSLKHVPSLVAGHSYFTDGPDSVMITVRKKLADSIRKYNLSFWQSEYCMLADGFKDGNKGDRSAMDCALFLAKVIHHDISVANASAWQYWNSYEPGKADVNTRYYLIALQPNEAYTDGEFTATKNLWALGHYSLFVRPGMQRITLEENKSDTQNAAQCMVTAYEGNGSLVVVAINYSSEEKLIQPMLKNFQAFTKSTRYVTTASPDDNMKAYDQALNDAVRLSARSISTIVYK